MKRLGLFILFAMFTLYNFANTTEIAVPDTAIITFNETYNNVKANIIGLAKALEVPAEQVYTIIIRQQVVESISFSIGLFIIIVLSILVIILNVRKLDNSEISVVYIILGGLFLFVGFMILIINFCDIITGFVNPEYDAIKSITEFIK